MRPSADLGFRVEHQGQGQDRGIDHALARLALKAAMPSNTIEFGAELETIVVLAAMFDVGCREHAVCRIGTEGRESQYFALDRVLLGTTGWCLPAEDEWRLRPRLPGKQQAREHEDSGMHPALHHAPDASTTNERSTRFRVRTRAGMWPGLTG